MDVSRFSSSTGTTQWSRQQGNGLLWPLVFCMARVALLIEERIAADHDLGVGLGDQGHHYHPAGDPCALASGRLSPLLALEIPLLWRPAPNRRGPTRADPADER